VKIIPDLMTTGELKKVTSSTIGPGAKELNFEQFEGTLREIAYTAL
jgi:hypothetical protein